MCANTITSFKYPDDEGNCNPGGDVCIQIFPPPPGCGDDDGDDDGDIAIDDPDDNGRDDGEVSN
jgi:hypothetical protein